MAEAGSGLICGAVVLSVVVAGGIVMLAVVVVVGALAGVVCCAWRGEGRGGERREVK